MKVLVTGAAGFIGMHVYTAGRAIDRLPGPQHTSLRRVFLVGNNRLAPRRWMPRQEMRYQLPEVKQLQQTALMHAQTFVPNQTMQACRLAATRRAW
jgi:nucleoside-diphosphate-sugar epimerase